jgi:hypothetical protein
MIKRGQKRTKSQRRRNARYLRWRTVRDACMLAADALESALAMYAVKIPKKPEC